MIITLLTNIVQPPQTVPGVLHMLTRYVKKILSTNDEIRVDWDSYTPQTGRTTKGGGYADQTKVCRLGQKGNYRIVARKPINKRAFLGLYFGRKYWTASAANALGGKRHDALLTLKLYNCSIPLETWLIGERVVDAGLQERRSCWMACANYAEHEDDEYHNAVFEKDGRCFARRNIQIGEEIRFIKPLNESFTYCPPCVCGGQCARDAGCSGEAYGKSESSS